MIVTKIALTTIIAMVVLAFVLVAATEEFRFHKWTQFSNLDKALTICILVAAVSAVIGAVAIVWGL